MNCFEKALMLLTLALVCGLVLTFLTDETFTSPRGPTGDRQRISRVVLPNGQPLNRNFARTVENVVLELSPSIVTIFALESQSIYAAADPLSPHFNADAFFRDLHCSHPGSPSCEQRLLSMGTGIVATEDGVILTNHHVVESADKLLVALRGGKNFAAEVIGTDPTRDISLVKVEDRELPVPTLGNSDQLRVGQWVIGIGKPFRLLHTVTAGIISFDGLSSTGPESHGRFIHTDGAVNPQDGVLVNLDGDVVGINTSIRNPSSKGTTLAVPINTAKSIMENLLCEGQFASD